MAKILYEVCASNGLQKHEVLAETDQSFVIQFPKSKTEWVVNKSMVSEEFIDGKPYCFNEELAKNKLRLLINQEKKKIERFEQQLKN